MLKLSYKICIYFQSKLQILQHMCWEMNFQMYEYGNYRLHFLVLTLA